MRSQVAGSIPLCIPERGARNLYSFFLGFSYGFRPGRDQHDALDALAVGITSTKVNWIVDADIAGKEPAHSSATLSAGTPRNAPKATHALRAQPGNQAC
jgi:hypothetical protein